MILDKIIISTKKRVENLKKEKSFESIKKEALSISKNSGFVFAKALKKDRMSFICEIKKASPSKGIICEDFDHVKIVKEYESAGADAISVLTEPEFFMGSNRYLTEIKKEVNVPILRKDFIVDLYQVYESKILGADAVLLICSALNFAELKEYMEAAAELGMSALVETHDEKEIEIALNAGAQIIGVNNRNLKDFKVDFNNSIKLKKLIPEDKIFVSESGIKTRENIKLLRENKTDAVLIGEGLIKSANIKGKLEELRGKIYDKN